MQLSLDEIMDRPTAFRRDFMNTLPGPRGVHLIGTKGHRGTENLAVFNSVVHLGASPPLLGFVIRPLTVPRHTYHHLRATGWFTLNTLHPDILERGHQSSANYGLQTSEFAEVGLTPYYSAVCKAPYVQESRIRLGLTLEEEHPVAANGTLFIVGKVREVFVPDALVGTDGRVDHAAAETLTVAGLNTYYRPADPRHLAYARPE